MPPRQNICPGQHIPPFATRIAGSGHGPNCHASNGDSACDSLHFDASANALIFENNGDRVDYPDVLVCLAVQNDFMKKAGALVVTALFGLFADAALADDVPKLDYRKSCHG